MRYLLLLLLASPARAASLVMQQDLGPSFSSSTWFASANSSCTADLSGISASAFGGTALTIGVATITFAVDGNNPVHVCYEGSAYEVGSGQYAAWGFLVDGLYVDDYTSVNGVLGVTPWSTGVDTNLTKCATLAASKVSAGSHKWTLTMHARNNTIQPGCHQTASTCKAVFCVRNYH